MEFHDRVLKCSECGAEFVFTAGEQMFFADKGFKNEPKRCKGCKAKRAEEAEGAAEPPRREQKRRPLARNAERKPRFPSGPHKGARYFAGNASRHEDRWERLKTKRDSTYSDATRRIA